MKKIYFIGRFPAQNEVGGVITFTNNFAKKYYKKGMIFFDIYPSKNKIIPKDVEHITFKNAPKFFIFIRLIINLRRSGTGVIFNFSSVRSLVLLSLIPKNKNKWFLILHNGDQDSKYSELSFFEKKIVSFAIKKVSYFGSISTKQRLFYLKLRVPEYKIYQISPYISLSGNSTSVTNKETIFLISGYPTKIYRMIKMLTILQLLHEEGFSFKVNICIYGKDSDGIKYLIIDFVKKMDFAFLYESLNSDDFNKLLSSSSVYLRMNSVDSYGLVIAEAINAGLQVLATDVCRRYPGTNIIKVDDFYSFESALRYFLKHKKFPNEIICQGIDERYTTDYNKIINELL